MNYKMMGRFLAQILSVEGFFMIPALLISLFCGETTALHGYMVTMLLIIVLVTVLFLVCRGAPSVFRAREGLVCVGISWIVLSAVGSSICRTNSCSGDGWYRHTRCLRI